MPKQIRLTIVILLLSAAAGCSFPGLGAGTPTSMPSAPVLTPTPLPPTPPTLADVDPARGEALPLHGPLVLYFDQPMDKGSVEGALSISPTIPISSEWLDSATLRLTPHDALPTSTTLRVTIGVEARSAAGLNPSAPLVVERTTPGDLEILQVLPAPDTENADPDIPITVVFNRPVVPLGVEGGLPEPLTLSPAIPGQGEWLDTSVYLFRPEGSLPGGVHIQASIAAGLADTLGATLRDPFRWSFTTAAPRVIALEPASLSSNVDRDTAFSITFNQRMQEETVEAAFRLLAPGSQPVEGSFRWEDDGRRLIFTPAARLAYNANYKLFIDERAASLGGSGLANRFEADFRTVPQPAVIGSSPDPGGAKEAYASVQLSFNAPMDRASLLRALRVEPQVEGLGTYWDSSENRLSVYGDFQPSSEYTLTLQASASDPYGTALGEDYILSFRTKALPPFLDFAQYGEVLTLASGRPHQILVQARGVKQVSLSLYRLTFAQFIKRLGPSGRGGIEGTFLRAWEVSLESEQNINQEVPISLGETPLEDGFYLLQLAGSPFEQAPIRILEVRDTEIILKRTPDRVLTWAFDLQDGRPLEGLIVRLLGENGEALSSARTDAEGLAVFPYKSRKEPYKRLYATSAAPGEPHFGLTATTFAGGISPYSFGLNMDSVPPESKVYLYTDRPIYRPGQTVHFRGVLRQAHDGRYQPPEISQLSLKVYDAEYETWGEETVALSQYGTFSGQIELDDDAPLGVWSLATEYGSLYFDVAAYRKPEFTVEVTPAADDLAGGDALEALISAQYFFGGPVQDAQVHWTIWSDPYSPPGIPLAIDWYRYAVSAPPMFGGEPIAQGIGRTDAQGRLAIQITPDQVDSPQRLTIEATLSDASGLPVTGRGEVALHPAQVYFAIAPERYALRVGETAVAEVQSLDWDGAPMPDRALRILVERVTWEQMVNAEGRIRWEAQGTTVNRAELSTGPDGTLRVSFDPPQAGNYRLTVEGEDDAGRTASSSLTFWVSGPGGYRWRQPPAGRMSLVPDKTNYKPGDTAFVLVPTPFDTPATALITLERGDVLAHWIETISPDDNTIEVPLEALYAPNVYLSVILLRPAGDSQPAATAVGMIDIEVDASHLKLQVSLEPDRTEAQPGEIVTYHLLARNADGAPVRAEFSLALTDLAALSLAEPNSQAPFEAFYHPVPLSVRTSASLAVSADLPSERGLADGMGGGGGEAELTEVRQEFPDTAFWRASVITDEQGRATVRVTLPDSLTTWRMEARGVTLDTLAGDAVVDIIASKALLIRPITPRFFTAGDSTQVAAVVHNNGLTDLNVTTDLLTVGARVLDEASQEGTIPAGGSQRFDWTLAIEAGEGVDLTFRVEGGGLSDASKPTVGTVRDGLLPVLRYSAPDTAATAGALPSAGARLEIINLPRRYDATQGKLQIAADPSLGAAMLSALESVQPSPYLSNESAISAMLPNLATLAALRATDVRDPALEAQLEETIQRALRALKQGQHNDGGWGWWNFGPSDDYLTAYILYGLTRAGKMGFSIDEAMQLEAANYLLAGLLDPSLAVEPERLDRQAFVLLALAQVGSGDLAMTRRMAADAGNLSRWAEAALLETLAILSPGDPLTETLKTQVEASAVRSATGDHWDESRYSRWNLGSAVRSTSFAVRALAAVQPDHPLLPGAIRWLLAARAADGAWASSHETAWTLLSISDWIQTQDGVRAGYPYQLTLNGAPLLSGEPGTEAWDPRVEVREPIDALLAGQPNQLLVQRGEGAGTLYYTAHLTAYRPVEQVPASSHGLSIARAYFHYDGECDGVEKACPPAETATAGEELLVRLTLTLPTDQYHLEVEDPFPAGAEPHDRQLLTEPQRASETFSGDPLRGGMGWWRFERRAFGDESLRLYASYLPAGTYQYTYLLRAAFPGQYRVLPPRVWATYFPEVYGQGAGSTLTIEP